MKLLFVILIIVAILVVLPLGGWQILTGGVVATFSLTPIIPSLFFRLTSWVPWPIRYVFRFIAGILVILTGVLFLAVYLLIWPIVFLANTILESYRFFVAGWSHGYWNVIISRLLLVASTTVEPDEDFPAPNPPFLMCLVVIFAPRCIAYNKHKSSFRVSFVIFSPGAMAARSWVYWGYDNSLALHSKWEKKVNKKNNLPSTPLQPVPRTKPDTGDSGSSLGLSDLHAGKPTRSGEFTDIRLSPPIQGRRFLPKSPTAGTIFDADDEFTSSNLVQHIEEVSLEETPRPSPKGKTAVDSKARWSYQVPKATKSASRAPEGSSSSTQNQGPDLGGPSRK